MAVGETPGEDGLSLYARDPLPHQLVAVGGRGSKAVFPPVAIVWPCPLSVEAVRGGGS